jgi:hypothetical protein
MAITASKLVALLIAVGYFVAGIIAARPGFGGAATLLVALLFPLALIWFPQLGSSWPRKKTVLYTYDDSLGGLPRRPYRDSHPAIVAFMGWFFLLGLPIVLYFIWR